MTDKPPELRLRAVPRAGPSGIRAFDAEHRELALSEVARSTGLTRAAARRFLLTLVKLGYVNSSQGRFSLRLRVLELGYAYLSSLSLPEVAQPHMEALVAEVNESCSISVLDELDVVYVARVPTRRIMSITLAVGHPPAGVRHLDGSRAAAGLPDDELEERLERIEIVPLTSHTVKDKEALREILAAVRRQGYAATDQELEEGLRSVAVPLRGGSGAVTAALNVSVHASRASIAVLRRDSCPWRFGPRRRSRKIFEAPANAHRSRSRSPDRRKQNVARKSPPIGVSRSREGDRITLPAVASSIASSGNSSSGRIQGSSMRRPSYGPRVELPKTEVP